MHFTRPRTSPPPKPPRFSHPYGFVWWTRISQTKMRYSLRYYRGSCGRLKSALCDDGVCGLCVFPCAKPRSRHTRTLAIPRFDYNTALRQATGKARDGPRENIAKIYTYTHPLTRTHMCATSRVWCASLCTHIEWFCDAKSERSRMYYTYIH